MSRWLLVSYGIAEKFETGGPENNRNFRLTSRWLVPQSSEGSERTNHATIRVRALSVLNLISSREFALKGCAGWIAALRASY